MVSHFRMPPAVEPVKQSKILGPFRRGVSRFRRFAFRFRVLGTPGPNCIVGMLEIVKAYCDS
jgi:hypothetical protein